VHSRWRPDSLAVRSHMRPGESNCRKIAITLKMPEKGETKARTCAISTSYKNRSLPNPIDTLRILYKSLTTRADTPGNVAASEGLGERT
jgi:hypothetical protein